MDIIITCMNGSFIKCQIGAYLISFFFQVSLDQFVQITLIFYNRNYFFL